MNFQIPGERLCSHIHLQNGTKNGEYQKNENILITVVQSVTDGQWKDQVCNWSSEIILPKSLWPLWAQRRGAWQGDRGTTCTAGPASPALAPAFVTLWIPITSALGWLGNPSPGVRFIKPLCKREKEKGNAVGQNLSRTGGGGIVVTCEAQNPVYKSRPANLILVYWTKSFFPCACVSTAIFKSRTRLLGF